MTGQDKTSLVTTRDDFTSQGCSRPTCYRRESLLKRSLYRRAARRVERDAPAYRAERSVTEERVRSRRTDELTEQRKPPTTSRRVEAADNTGPRRGVRNEEGSGTDLLRPIKKIRWAQPIFFFLTLGYMRKGRKFLSHVTRGCLSLVATPQTLPVKRPQLVAINALAVIRR